MVDEPDPVSLPIEDSLDLHAFAPKDVRPVECKKLHHINISYSLMAYDILI